MKAVVDRIVQYANRYQLTNVETGEVLGTFDFEEVTGTVQQVGTEIDKELFDSIANDLAARVKLSGGELAGTVVTFSDISGTAANVASGDTSATLWGKVKNWFSRLKALAFKNKVGAGDFEAGAIKNADVAADAAIAQSKVSGLMTDYVASISASGRTVTYKNKNGVNMGSITTQDTTYGLASQSSNGLMSSTDKTKLDAIESGAQKNTVLGVKGSSESAYRTGNVNITKANIGLGNVDNTSDEDKPVSTATQTALNGKANTSGTYPNLTVGKATNADKATNATNATNAANATKATQDANGNVIDKTYAKLSQVVRTDAAQSLTDAQKQQAQRNILLRSSATLKNAGWYKIANSPNGVHLRINLANAYSGAQPSVVQIDVYKGHTDNNSKLEIKAEGCAIGYFTKLRIFNNNDIEVYCSASTNTTTATCMIELTARDSNDVTIYSFEPSTNTGSALKEIDIKNGINTTGNIYQNGEPVLIGDQSAIFESDGVTVKEATKAAQDADGNVIPDTYATKVEATRTATYEQQGQVKMGSTTNGGDIADNADSDDVVPTIKNICDWVRNNMLPSEAPSWTENTNESLKLPNSGWYCINYSNASAIQWYSTGVFYWEKGDRIYLPISAYLFSTSVFKRAVNIQSDGTVSVFDAEDGSKPTDLKVRYYQLA